MSSGRYGLVLREVGRLLAGGSVASMGTGQLLERYAADRDEAAFEALVNQHGPMVLGTCRRMLSDPHDVDDAFQATFLVLARKAASIRDADRLGPWLHGVARRVATRSRALSARRNARERSSAEEPAFDPPDVVEGFELRAAIDEELSRLPDKYRAPLVLCYLEGLTHDEAARQLRWPVGTVRSRLAGGRDRLRDRLTRRGLAPSATVPAIVAHASIPQPLLTTTVRVATSAGSVPAHVANLAKGALAAMMWGKFKMVAAVGLMTGLTVGGAGVAAQQGGGGKVAPKVASISEDFNEKGLQKELQAAKNHIESLNVQMQALKTRWKTLEASDPKSEIVLAEIARVTDERDRLWEEVKAEYTKAMDLTFRLRQLEPTKTAEPTVQDLATKLTARAGDLQKKLDEANNQIKRLEDELQATRSSEKQQLDLLKTEIARLREQQAAPLPNVPGKKAANPRPRPASPMVMQLGGAYVLTIPAERDRAIVLNTETATRATQRLPEGLTQAMPVVSAGLAALLLEGPEVRQIAVFNIRDGKWYPQDLKEPTTKANPIVGPQDTTYEIGRFLHVFSTQAGKWSSLELKREPRSGYFPRQDGKIIIPEGDVIHVYNNVTGEWTHNDIKEAETETKALPNAPPPAPPAPSPGNPPPSTGSARRPAQPVVHTLQGDPPTFMVISAERDRVTMIDSATQERTSFRLPRPATTITPVSGLLESLFIKGPEVTRTALYDRRARRWYEHDLKEPATEVNAWLGNSMMASGKEPYALQIKGPRVSQLAVFDMGERKWVTQDLREPAKDGIDPAVTPTTVSYRVGRFLYIYSALAKKWTILELNRTYSGMFNVIDGPTQLPPVDGSGKMVLPDGDIIHIYDAKTGEWTDIDTNEPDTKTQPLPKTGGDAPGPGTGPASKGPAAAKPQPSESRARILEGSLPLHAMIARDSGRITMVDPESNRRLTYSPPEGSGMSIIDPVYAGNDLFVIGMKGQRITQSVVFDRKAWQWHVLDMDDPVTRVVPHACLSDETPDPSAMVGLNWDGPSISKVATFNPRTRQWASQSLKEPAQRHLYTTVHPEVVTSLVGRFFYVYSVPANRWSTLELKAMSARNGQGRDFSPKDGRILVQDGDAVHSFDIKTSEWTRIE